MYLPPFMSDDYLDTKIKSMFDHIYDLYDKIFEAMCTISDQISDKKQ